MRILTSKSQFYFTLVLFSDDRLFEACTSPNCNLLYCKAREKCIMKKRCRYLKKQRI